ncbi:MAG: SigE family RNA polymerase sigma factor [Acidimicrobiales bacterium]
MGEVPASFESYVVARSASMLRLAWLLTADADEAEDLVQAALGRVFARWGRVSAADDVDAYVRRVLVNAHRSRLRRKRVRQVALVAADAVADTRDGLAAVVDRGGLAAALRSLPLRQRQIVVLRYVEDLSAGETAKLLGCPLGTVKSGAARALAALRDHPALQEAGPGSATVGCPGNGERR